MIKALVPSSFIAYASPPTAKEENPNDDSRKTRTSDKDDRDFPRARHRTRRQAHYLPPLRRQAPDHPQRLSPPRKAEVIVGNQFPSGQTMPMKPTAAVTPDHPPRLF